MHVKIRHHLAKIHENTDSFSNPLLLPEAELGSQK